MVEFQWRKQDSCVCKECEQVSGASGVMWSLASVAVVEDTAAATAWSVCGVPSSAFAIHLAQVVLTRTLFGRDLNHLAADSLSFSLDSTRTVHPYCVWYSCVLLSRLITLNRRREYGDILIIYGCFASFSFLFESCTPSAADLHLVCSMSLVDNLWCSILLVWGCDAFHVPCMLYWIGVQNFSY